MSNTGLYLTQAQRVALEQRLQSDIHSFYHQRISIILMTDEGKSQAEICSYLRCCSTTASHWIHVAKMGMPSQWREHPVGRPKVVNEKYTKRLYELLSSNPQSYGYPFSKWTLAWLNKHLSIELGVAISDRHLKRILKDLGLSTRSQSAIVAPKPEDSRIQIGDLSNVGGTGLTENESDLVIYNLLQA
jgi:transposase